jgi:hypothetical protein
VADPQDLAPAPFAEVNDAKARTRDKSGRFKALGASVESDEVRGVTRAEKVRDYRKFLATMEPAAFRVLQAALNNKLVSMKDKIEIAQDILTRMHGKVLGSTEADDARRRVEAMSTDELKAHLVELAKEMGLDFRARTVS